MKKARAKFKQNYTATGNFTNPDIRGEIPKKTFRANEEIEVDVISGDNNVYYYTSIEKFPIPVSIVNFVYDEETSKPSRTREGFGDGTQAVKTPMYKKPLFWVATGIVVLVAFIVLKKKKII